MNFLEKETQKHKKKKRERRKKFFEKIRPHTLNKSNKVRCGVKGCSKGALKLKGRMPDCGQHNFK